MLLALAATAAVLFLAFMLLRFWSADIRWSTSGLDRGVKTFRLYTARIMISIATSIALFGVWFWS